jgi:hypothetical protein
MAHLAFDPARIAAAAAGDDPVLEKLIEQLVMKGFAQLRGE